MEVVNAIILSTSLGSEGHGIFTANLMMKGESWAQGFGNYHLNHNAALFISRTLEVVGVERWEDLKGKPCRIRRDDPSGSITAIGNLIEEKWFEPRKELA